MTTMPDNSGLLSPQSDASAADLNNLLAPLEDQITADLEAPELPVVFIIGAPRSGTTLTYQLLVARGGFAYISNFLARFWQVPSIGIHLENAVGLREKTYHTDFTSEYGRTRGWLEPHEFGYFWDRWFDQGQTSHKLDRKQLSRVDIKRLRRVVASIENGYGAPVVFANNTWCTFQIEYLARVFPTSLFVVCEREPLYIAQSILIGRRRLQDSQTWWSVRPLGHEAVQDQPWWKQIGWQVSETIREMHAGLERVAEGRQVKVQYEELCQDPVAKLENIVERARDLGATLPPARPIPDRFDCTNNPRVPNADLKQLEEALRRIEKESAFLAPVECPKNASE